MLIECRKHTENLHTKKFLIGSSVIKGFKKMSEALAIEVLRTSPAIFIICLILWIIYSLIKSGKLKGSITFGSDEKRKK